MDLKEILSMIDDLVWGPAMLFLLVGTGVFLTVRLHFLPWRNLGFALKSVLGRDARKTDVGHGDVSPFASLCTALAATIGTGNIVSGSGMTGSPLILFPMKPPSMNNMR